MVRRKRSRERPTIEVGESQPSTVTVPRDITRVTSDDEARELAVRLLRPGRTWPVAVVTIASGQAEPFVDVDELTDALRGLVEVVIMPTSDVSWSFSAVMPNQTQVYGGASRVYPVDHDWVLRPSTAPLRFAYSMRDRTVATEHLINDSMAAAVAAGLFAPRSSTTEREATGVVLGTVGARALIRLDDGSPASLWEELSGYDVELARLVRPGQPLSGAVDLETRRFVLDSPARAVWPAEYTVGAAVLAEVVAATSTTLGLSPVHGLECGLDRSAVTTNDHDRLDALFGLGDIVVARVVGTNPPALSMLDVDDDEPTLEAPAILNGGPPWLAAPDSPDLPPVAEEPDVPAPLAGPERSAAVPAPAPDGSVAVAAIASVQELSRTPTPLDIRTGKTAPPSAPKPSSPEPEPEPEPAMGPAVRDLSLSLQAAQARVAALESQLSGAIGTAHELEQMREHSRNLERRLDASEVERKALRIRYRDADRARQRLERATDAGAGEDAREFFDDEEEALRFAVTAAWAFRVPPGEKSRWPLREWQIGPEFIASLANLGQVSWRKLAEVVCDVVLADPQRMRALDHHELREDEGGGARPVVRADGATCFRVALQRNSPSARRLHFWRRGDQVELSRVVLHDDTAP